MGTSPKTRKGKQRAVVLTDEQWDKLGRLYGAGRRNAKIAEWIDSLPEGPPEGNEPR